MSERKNGNLTLLSKYRNELFGISIIEIMIFHFFEDNSFTEMVGMQETLTRGFISLFGSIGVEVFIFLSAMGLCFSMKKNSNVIGFYGKRIKRLLIPYAIAGTLYWVLRGALVSFSGIGRFLEDWTLLSFWTKGVRSLWFITFIMVMYLIYPLLFHIFDGSGKKGLLWCVLLITAVVLGIFRVEAMSEEIYTNINIALWRIPIFILGAYVGERVYNGESLRWWDVRLISLGFITKALHMPVRYKLIKIRVGDYSLAHFTGTRYGTLIWSVFIIWLLVVLMDKIRWKPLHDFLRLVGSYSLELYLIHVSLRYFFFQFGLPVHRLWVWVIYILLSAVLSVPLHNATEVVVAWLDKRK